MSKAGTLKRAAKELANPVAKQVKRKKFVYDGEVWDFQLFDWKWRHKWSYSLDSQNNQYWKLNFVFT